MYSWFFKPLSVLHSRFPTKTIIFALKKLKKPPQKGAYLGGIQVLRHHDFDLFWPTHPPTLSSDVIISYTHLNDDVIISSYPPTYSYFLSSL